MASTCWQAAHGAASRHAITGRRSRCGFAGNVDNGGHDKAEGRAPGDVRQRTIQYPGVSRRSSAGSRDCPRDDRPWRSGLFAGAADRGGAGSALPQSGSPLQQGEAMASGIAASPTRTPNRLSSEGWQTARLRSDVRTSSPSDRAWCGTTQDRFTARNMEPHFSVADASHAPLISERVSAHSAIPRVAVGPSRTQRVCARRRPRKNHRSRRRGKCRSPLKGFASLDRPSR
jgi:hypothetical protein